MDFSFPEHLESGDRVAIVNAGADTEFYVIDEDAREFDVREDLGASREIAAIVTVE